MLWTFSCQWDIYRANLKLDYKQKIQPSSSKFFSKRFPAERIRWKLSALTFPHCCFCDDDGELQSQCGYRCTVVTGYSRGSEVIGADIERARAVLSAVTSHQTVSVNTRRVRVSHQLDLHPSMTHVVINLRQRQNFIEASTQVLYCSKSTITTQ